MFPGRAGFTTCSTATKTKYEIHTTFQNLINKYLFTLHTFASHYILPIVMSLKIQMLLNFFIYTIFYCFSEHKARVYKSRRLLRPEAGRFLFTLPLLRLPGNLFLICALSCASWRTAVAEGRRDTRASRMTSESN